MGQLVRVSVLAPDDVLRDYGAAALVRLERADSAGGAYVEIDTDLVESEKFSYEIYDATGTTTSFYRSRFSNAAASQVSEYGAVWSHSAPLAYATLDDLLLGLSQEVDDTRFLANAEQKLVDATNDIDNLIGYSALRSTGTKLFHGDGRGVLHVHGGIVSLTGIDVRLSTGGAWTPLQVQDTGWILEGDLDNPEAAGGIFYHVRTLDTATYSSFPNVRQGVRLSGVFGGDAVKRKPATIVWARQRLALDPSTPGGLLTGPDELGAASTPDRWPRQVYDLVTTERRRFWCHVFGAKS